MAWAMAYALAYANAEPMPMPSHATQPLSGYPIPLTGNMDFFSLKGRPAYYTSIGLGASKGSPHQNQYLESPSLLI
jgi:hypothetical protein